MTKPSKNQKNSQQERIKKNIERKKSLNNKEKDRDCEFIYGKHAVLEHLKSRHNTNKIFLQKGFTEGHLTDIMSLANEFGIVYQVVPKSKLDVLVEGAVHQGVVASIPPYQYSELEDAFNLAKLREEEPFFIILDGIEDPHNLGSILRTADAVGVHGIIIPKRRSASLTATVAKTSTGAIEHVPVIRVTNLVQVINQLKQQGVWVFASDMEGEDMRSWRTQGSIAVIIGNEGSGVSDLVKKNADGVVTIPMVGHVQSLNASVAAALLMYEVARFRMKG